ncbi:mRNA capping enzyme-domain-containing protein [Aspergillus cavernicola]|uniref:mRNA cap guanine-N(7) methyltransferase n=1 Tax=Aspergillus cavernicola TaxID=176166 RepID=A0ABR4J5D6_9EURO
MSYALETKKRKFHRVLESLTKPSNTEPSSNQPSASAATPLPSAKRARLTGRDDSILASVRKDILKIARPTSRSSSVSSQSRPSFVPWDRERFLERLETFRRVDRWSPKPSAVNEVEWAKRGWICADVARVTCVGGCGGSVVVKFPDELDELDGYDSEKIQERKEVPTIHRLPLTNPDTAISNFRTRYSYMLKMADQLPDPDSFQVPEGFTARDIISILPSQALHAHEPRKETTEMQQPDSEINQEHHDVSQHPAQVDPPINEAAFVLAFFGWDSVDGAKGLAGCGACFRRLGLWMYKPQDRDATAHDPLDAANEHMEYCPWINRKTQSGTANSSEKTEGLHSGWELLAQALKVKHLRQTRSSTPITSRAGSEALSLDDPVTDGTNDDVKKAKDREWWAKIRRMRQKNRGRDSPATAANDRNASPIERKRKLAEEEDKSNSTADRSGSKRKRLQERYQKLRRPDRAPPSIYSRRDADENAPRNRNQSSNRSPSPLPPRRSPTPEAQSRQRKRPGGGARMGLVDPETMRRRQEERDRAQTEDAMRFSQNRGMTDIVRQHYNAVPQRGREWRKTESKIKGLRTFNNWVKSTLIQKFSPDEEFVTRSVDTVDWANGAAPPPSDEKRLLVIDLGCGKGGDLGKWQLAPQPIELYVGLDPADISISQARDRYSSMRSGRGPRQRRGPLFHAEFAPKDCFGEWLGDVPIVQQVGIDSNVGPGGSLMASRWGGGGFDVVASMFTIHYAFESEEKTRQMLRNVAGVLKKGGRFLGVCPNSDKISAQVAEYHTKKKEREVVAKQEAAEPEDGEVEEEDKKVEWGNSIYRVRFPGATPEDGIFRPPFGWKYSYFMEEAVEEIPEYVVPWEAFRALTQDYNLELQYRKPFLEVWRDEKDDSELGALSERMGVRDRATGDLMMTEEEKEAASHREPNPNRARQTATPRHRGERAGTPPLPEYEAPVAPLNEVGRNALVSLLRSQALRQLKTHIQHAEMKIQESAGEVNERATDARVRLQKERDRMGRSMTEGREGGSNGDGEGGEGNREEAARLKGYEEAVREVTGKLDVSMRRAIDSEVRVDALGEVLGGLQGEIDAGGNAGGQGQRQRRRRRTRHDDGDEEEEGEDDDAGLYEASPEVEGGGEEGSLIRKLDERMAEDSAKWEGLSLTERYSKNNSYIGFYRIIHEAKHPGDDIPPLPHASTWFSHLEDPNASSTRNNSSTSPNTHSRRASRQNNRPRSASASDSDDVAIERERISLKCPLTLLPFADPVTSTKCPHSFEREAIAAMITQSTLTVPTPSASGSGSGRGRRIRAIKCPVCSEVLTANDLREDPVLLRRIRRAAAMLKRDREEEEEAELGLSGRRKRQSGIMLGSDDEAGEGVEQGVSRGGNRMEVDRVRIKQERARSRGVTEVGDGDEQDDAMGSETESETGDEEDSNSNGGSDSEE